MLHCGRYVITWRNLPIVQFRHFFFVDQVPKTSRFPTVAPVLAVLLGFVVVIGCVVAVVFAETNVNVVVVVLVVIVMHVAFVVVVVVVVVVRFTSFRLLVGLFVFFGCQKTKNVQEKKRLKFLSVYNKNKQS